MNSYMGVHLLESSSKAGYRIAAPAAPPRRGSAVERQKLVLALEEQKLGARELVAEEDRPVEASAMLFGSYVVVDDQIRIDIRLVEVETSLTKFSKDTTTSLSSVETEMQKLAEILGENLFEP